MDISNGGLESCHVLSKRSVEVHLQLPCAPRAGVMGMKTGSLGPKRQIYVRFPEYITAYDCTWCFGTLPNWVCSRMEAATPRQDRTYYLVELRKRCQELVDEVYRLNKEINDIQQDCRWSFNVTGTWPGSMEAAPHVW